MSNVEQRISNLSEEQRKLLAQRLAALKKQRVGQAQIRPFPRTGNQVPLSFSQQRIWFLEQFAPGNPVYNMSGVARIFMPVNVAVLERCFNEVIRRHEVLRTTFAIVDGEPVGLVGDPEPIVLQVIDLQKEVKNVQEAKARSLLTQEAVRPFDLRHGPLMRVLLLQLADAECMVQLTMHHIVSDGWSTGVFFQEIGALYRAHIAGQPSPLSDLPFQYADFACWQQQWQQSSALQPLLDYWQQRLDGATDVLALPTDLPRPSMQSYRGARMPLHIAPEMVRDLKALGGRHSATLFMTLLAAFNVLLYRYTSQEDLLVGIPVANRDKAGTERLIGAFLNTLVIRTNLGSNLSFVQLLEQVRKTTLDAYAHQDLPFEKLVEQLQPVRDLSHAPLFQVLFNFQVDTTQTARVAGLTLEDIHNGTTQVDLALNLVEKGATLDGYIEYNTDLFVPQTIERLIGHYQTLLRGVIVQSQQSILTLPLLSEAEKLQTLVEWNATDMVYPADASIHQLIERQVEATPSKVAVICGEQSLTYQQLNTQATQLAYALRKQFAPVPETHIGLCVERSLDMVVALLAILKVGCAYVPLDPEYPQERLAFVLQDAEVHILLTQSRLLKRIPQSCATPLCLDTDWQYSEDEPDTDLLAEVPATNLAYTIYTSGSTGRPKGVQITHRAVVNFLSSMSVQPGFTAQDTLLAVTSLSFDIAGLELYLPLTNGATLVIANRQDTMDGQRLAKLMDKHPVTVMQATPSTWRLLLDADWQGSSQLSILCGGEAFPPDLAQQLLPRCAALWNMYGPTETTIWSTICEITAVDGPLPIGRPIANTQVYVLNEQKQPAPVGVAGELYIGGTGVSRGYWHRPELTSEKFITDPFRPDATDGIYRTGDLVRYRHDGLIEFLGRIDSQVKLRGFRIELGEIEAVISQHPAVKQAVVVVREDEPGNKVLVAYLVSQQGVSHESGASSASISTEELRQAAREKLPEYMMPAKFVTLAEFPLTPNGKIDRRALPAPTTVVTETSNKFVAPRNELERKLVEIWSKLLGINTVGIHENFFDLGGHSLLATKLIFQVRDVLHVEIPLQFLFQQNPTIAGMAEVIQQEQAEDAQDVTVADAPLDLEAEAVLDADIRPEEGLLIHNVPYPQNIFFTGATGFMGAFLLAELLEQVDATIFCLVRAVSLADGMQRIQRALEYYGLWHAEYQTRIIPVLGDLTQPKFGLSSAEFFHLANVIDVIYHCGAEVNFLYAYKMLKPANVLGTKEVLRLACDTTVKPVHYVSTTYVFSRFKYAPGHVYKEDDDKPILGLEHTFGYTQSKWVAERMVVEAGKRGLPVYIYRPGRVAGHSQTGACQTYDFVWRTVKVGLSMKVAPLIDMTLDMTPVDYVCQALVHLSRQETLRGKIFHLVSPAPIQESRFVEWMSSYGYEAEIVSFREWCARVRDLAEQLSDETASALTPFLSGALPIDRMPPAYFDIQSTLDGLAGSSIKCPPIDGKLLTTYFTYFIKSGYVKPPTAVTVV